MTNILIGLIIIINIIIINSRMIVFLELQLFSLVL